MQKMFYYAKLNDNQVCIGFEENVMKLREHEHLVSIPDENKSLLYKKYLGSGGWSQERYEPEVDAVIQDRLNSLELENSSLKQENIELKLALAELAESNESKITELQMAIAELAEMGV